MSHHTLANGKSELAVNGALLARSLAQRGFSAREAARRSGVTFNIIRRATRQNAFSADLPLRHLLDLADLCDLTLPELLDPAATAPDSLEQHDDAPAPTEATAEAREAADTRQLAGYLLLNPAGGPPALIATAWEWRLNRLHAARRRLNTALDGTGILVANANGRYYVTVDRAHGTREQAKRDADRVAALAASTRPLTVAAARLLKTCLDGTMPGEPGDADVRELSQLVDTGLLCLGPDGDFQPSPAFQAAFL